jgi:hypothetical protein
VLKFISVFILVCSVVSCTPKTSPSVPCEHMQTAAPDVIPTNSVATEQIEGKKTEFKIKSVEKYTPNGRREIILVHDQKYEYIGNAFRDSVENSQVSNADQYSMMRGYLLSKQPEVDKGFAYYAFKMENGNTLYYQTVKNEKIDKSFGAKYSVFWYKDYQKYASKCGKPFVVGSSITYVSYHYRFNCYRLSNGKVKYVSTLNSLDELLSQLKKNKTKIAEILLDWKIRHDELDDSFRFSHGTFNGSDLVMYVTKKKNHTKANLFFTYNGRNWLFVDSIVPLVDGKKYAPFHGEAYRDSNDMVWEVMTFPYNDRMSKLINEISTSKKAILRFHGSRGYEDFLVPEEQKEALLKAINLYTLLKAST